MSQRAQGNIRVEGFGVTFGDETRRLDFPRADIEGLRGDAGAIEYGAGEISFDRLMGRLQGIEWSTEAASAGRFWVRDKQGRFEMQVGKVELGHGMRLTRSAGGGVEIVSPEAAFETVKLHIPDLTAFRKPEDPAAPTPEPPPAPVDAPLRQERLHFLDAVNGVIMFTIKVVLDLPVLGKRTLDQTVRLEIVDGTFDYKKLDDGLSWLEGQFLDIGLDGNRLRIGYGAPILGTKEIISWSLDQDASTAAKSGRVPLRSLADYRFGKPRAATPADNGGPAKRGRLRSLTLGDLAIELQMVAPRNVELLGGTIRFGGDDQPGIVDLHIEGSVVQPGAGALRAAAGALDMTVKDIRAGVHATADRLHVGPMDLLEVTFDGFTPRSLTASLQRVTATNLSLILGGADGH